MAEFVAACLFGECLIGLNYTHPQPAPHTRAFSAEIRARGGSTKNKKIKRNSNGERVKSTFLIVYFSLITRLIIKINKIQ